VGFDSLAGETLSIIALTNTTLGYYGLWGKGCGTGSPSVATNWR
jgi:hypothetical protein